MTYIMLLILTMLVLDVNRQVSSLRQELVDLQKVQSVEKAKGWL